MAAWIAGMLADKVGGWIFDKFLGTTIGKLMKSKDGSASSSTPTDLVEAAEGLKSRLLGIKAVLQDAEEWEIQEELVRDWLKKIKLLAYDAEDVLEDFEYEMLRYQIEGKPALESDASSSSSSSRKRKQEETEISPTLAKGLVDRINKINERFDVITKDREALHLKVGDRPRQYDDSESRPPTGSHVIESDIYGREDDRAKIVDRLLSGYEKFTVLPIIGMGGVGKTTVAQLVYNDERISRSFDLKGWVRVSNDFDVVQLTRAIMESFTKQSCNLTELSALQDIIKEKLKGKRVFLVLDDIWNENQHPWDTLKASLVGAKIMKILMTSRSKLVAGIMQTRDPYWLGCLTEENSWFLFERHAFAGRNSNEHLNLVEIGKQIVKKCSGLPLAVKVVGGLLRHKKADEENWEGILLSNLWELGETQTKILPALKLSYHYMPHYLKPCFLYSSLFPKDYTIEEDILVRLWVAQGYIIQPSETKSAEDVGREYVEELQKRSLLQFACIGRVRMHDLVHDLASYICGKECHQIMVESDTETYHIPSEVRHLYVISRLDTIPHRLFSCLPKALRTLVFEDQFSRLVLNKRFPLENLGYLRALEFHSIKVEGLPDSISNLKHLRHLIVERSQSHYRPQLSSRNWHFNRPTARSICMPRGIGKLLRLETLDCYFTVGRDAWHFGIEELKGLVNLRGRLCIGGLRNVARVEDATEANLQSKRKIGTLLFDWNEERCRDTKLEVAVLDRLRPCTNLRVLQITGYGGNRFPSWMGDPFFSRLVHVKLMSIENCESLPALGQLPSLKELIICYMPCLRSVGNEFCCALLTKNTPCMASFPSLESLSFAVMPDWEEWCGVSDGDFPHLSHLVIKQCPELRTLPLLRSTLRALEIVDSPQLMSQVVGLHNLSSLEQLTLGDCPQLRLPADKPLPPTLRELTLRECGRLNMVRLHGPQSALQKLIAEGCALLESVSGLHNLSSLRTLHLRDCPQLQLSPDSSEPLPPTLQHLEVERCSRLSVLPMHHNPTALQWLCIRDCPQLSSLVGGLHNLSSLQLLEFQGGCTIANKGSEEDLLDSLQGCTNLTTLRIERYHGSRFPTWMGNPCFSRLVTVKLSVVENCERLPALGQLPSLTFLVVEGIRCLRYMGREFCCNLTCENPSRASSFPSLERLFFEDMPEWEEWCGVVDGDFPRLSLLNIQRCPKLRSLPLLHTLSALVWLAIEYCDVLVSVSGLQGLTSLKHLNLKSCPKLQIPPSERLSSIPDDVTIEDCPGLIEWCQAHGFTHQ